MFTKTILTALVALLFTAPAVAQQFGHCFRTLSCPGAPPSPTAEFPTFATLLDIDNQPVNHCATSWFIVYESGKIEWNSTVTQATNSESNFLTGNAQSHPGTSDCPDCDTIREFRYFDDVPGNSLLIRVEEDPELRVFWTWLNTELEAEVITFPGVAAEAQNWIWNGSTCAPQFPLSPLNALQLTAVPEPSMAAAILPMVLFLLLLAGPSASTEDDEPSCAMADVDCDGTVDDEDAIDYAIGWHADYIPVCDLDGDNSCGDADLALYADAFQEASE